MARTGWTRITAGAALAGALCWLAKWATLLAQGGEEGPVDTAAFVVGLVLIVVGATSVGLRLTRGRGTGATVAACVGSAVVTFLLVPVVQILAETVFGEGTVAAGEGGLALLAAVAVVVGVTGLAAPRRVEASRTV